MTIFAFQNKIYEAVQNTFKTKYWDTHLDSSDDGSKVHDFDEDGCPEGASFKDLVEYLGTDKPTEIEETDPDGFINHLFYDFDVLKRYVVKKDAELNSKISANGKSIGEINCLFAPEMKLYTTNERGETTDKETLTENHEYCQMEIKDGNKISNSWTCPATGNLVVYGWLDSSAALNNKATPSAYCVIEAKINSSGQNENWEIISAQPVNPFKNITYVGFNLPVRKGLVIRARTGFTVGAKSGQFSNEQDGFDTLSNITPNGFKCMVYSNKEYRTEREEQDDDA